MKTVKMIFAALALAALMTSCTKESESNNESTNKTLEFTAVWAEADGSKTVLQEDGTSIWWNTNEEINVFIGEDASAKFISTNTKPQAIATFVGNALVGYSESSGDFPGYWAVYPYNAENTSDRNSVSLKVKSKQAAAEGTFADKCFPAVARSTNFSLAFWNVCGGARFSVVTEGVQRVVFRSNDGSPMAGKVRVDFGEDDKPQILEVTEPVDSVVLNAKDGSLVPGANYFAAMLPQMHAQGLTVTLYTATQRAVKTISKPITIHRSAFGMLDNVDEGLTYTDATLPEDEDDDTPYEMVDLGLSVKWATCNVGATSPEEYGDAFAWGETEPKEDYSWETYKWSMGGGHSDGSLTKYCSDSQCGYNGFSDYKIVLDSEDDAATVNWGGKWRTPTNDEWKELRENCTWRYTTLIDKDGFGIVGFKIISKIAGHKDKWIFLPFSADRYTSNYDSQKSIDGFWSSSLCTNSYFPSYYYGVYAAFYAYDVSVYASNADVGGFSDRCCGRTIRPVYGDLTLVHVNGVSVSPENATFNIGETIKLTATITPFNAYEKGLTWSSSDESVATVSANGLVTPVSKGSAEITVKTIDGGYSASCAVVVTTEFDQLVDLGLSVKWASINVGASYPWEYGDYFAWGEVESKEDYSWSTYKWCMNGSSNQLTKYCNNSSYGYNGFTDNKTVLDPEDDAAAVNWGGSWRMPTYDELNELMTQCTWTWTTLNGVYGRKVTSNKEGYTDKWIFLPAAGSRSGSSLYYAGSCGFYWSSSLDSGYPDLAYHVCFDSGGVKDYYYRGRDCGRSVRPISE